MADYERHPGCAIVSVRKFADAATLIFFWIGKFSVTALLVSTTAILLGSAIDISLQLFLSMEDAYVSDRAVSKHHLAFAVFFCGGIALFAWGYFMWIFLSLQLDLIGFAWHLLRWEQPEHHRERASRAKVLWSLVTMFFVVAGLLFGAVVREHDGAVGATWALWASMFTATLAVLSTRPDGTSPTSLSGLVLAMPKTLLSMGWMLVSVHGACFVQTRGSRWRVPCILPTLGSAQASGSFSETQFRYMVLVFGFLVLPAFAAALVLTGGGFPSDWRTAVLTSFFVVALCTTLAVNGALLIRELVVAPLLILLQKALGKDHKYLAPLQVAGVALPFLGGLLLGLGCIIFVENSEGTGETVDDLIIGGMVCLLLPATASLVLLAMVIRVGDTTTGDEATAWVPAIYFILYVSFWTLIMIALQPPFSAALLFAYLAAVVCLAVWTAVAVFARTAQRKQEEAKSEDLKARYRSRYYSIGSFGFLAFILLLLICLLPTVPRLGTATLFYFCVTVNGFVVFLFDRYNMLDLEEELRQDTKEGEERLGFREREFSNWRRSGLTNYLCEYMKDWSDVFKMNAGGKRREVFGWSKIGYAIREYVEDLDGDHHGHGGHQREQSKERKTGETEAATSEGQGAADPTDVKIVVDPTSQRRRRGIVSLVFVTVMNMIVFGMAMSAQSDEVVDEANPRTLTPVKDADRTTDDFVAQYATCPQRINGLDPVDLAYLVSLSYFYEPGSGELCRDVDTMQGCFDRYFNANYTEALGEPFAWDVLDVDIPDSRSSRRAALYTAVSAPANVVIVGVRGSVTVRDFLEDFSLYSEIAVLQVFSLLVPFIHTWPTEVTSFFVKLIAFAERFGLAGRDGDGLPVSNYYRHVERYIERNIRSNATYDGRDIVVIGHSLGAATAMIVGARQELRSFAFEPPGVLYSHEKFGIERVGSIYETAAVIKRDNDPVTFADRVVGDVQSLSCNDTFLSEYCHLMRPILCHLMYNCGALERPAFDSWGGGEVFCSDDVRALTSP